MNWVTTVPELSFRWRNRLPQPIRSLVTFPCRLPWPSGDNNTQNKFFACARAHTPGIVYQESTKTLKCCYSANSLNFLTMLGLFKREKYTLQSQHTSPTILRNKNHDTDRYSHYLGILWYRNHDSAIYFHNLVILRYRNHDNGTYFII